MDLGPDAPDGIELGMIIMRKSTIITFAILTIAMLPTSVSYAQFWEFVGGIGSALLENYIDNNSSYSSEVKQSTKNNLNTISEAINANQSARNVTRDACQGNYSGAVAGAVIQGAQAIMNAQGNHNYDTYLNSASQIYNANHEYKQDLRNGMDVNEALDKRNTTIGYSAAESVIELQDRIAREKLEKARRQREAERQSWENNNSFTAISHDEPQTNNEVNARTVTYSPNVFGGALIAYINTAAVLDAMPDKMMAEKELEDYYEELQAQLQAMTMEYQNKMQDYESNLATMSNVTRQSKEMEIVDLQNRIQQFQQSAESEFETKRAELLNPILYKIQNAINTVASENELTYVIDISTGAAVFLGEDAVDVTYMVMKRLGI